MQSIRTTKALLIVGALTSFVVGRGLLIPSTREAFAAPPPPKKFDPVFIGTCTAAFADEKLRVCYGTGIAATGPGLGTAIDRLQTQVAELSAKTGR